VPSHIALLRGINVGGNRRVGMPRLREVLTEAGLDNVRTLLQSGNVVADSRSSPTRVRSEIEAAIEAEFGFHVDVVMRTRDELAQVLDRNPLATVADNPKYYQVTFLSDDPGADAVPPLTGGDFGAERLVLDGREIYAWYPKGMQNSKLARQLSDARLGVTATARNWNTVTKLLALADA